MTFRFLYRCRRCNTVDDSTGIETTKPHAMLLMGSALYGSPDRETNAPTLFELHDCEDNGIGVSDLIGFRDQPTKKMSDTPRLESEKRAIAEKLARDKARLDRQTIETAPRDGTEILVWREDAGWLLARWIAPCDFLHDRELEKMNDSEVPDWFYADFVSGGRLDGGAPTHWMPLPEPPAIARAAKEQP